MQLRKKKKRGSIPFLVGMLIGLAAGVLFLLVIWLAVYRTIFP